MTELIPAEKWHAKILELLTDWDHRREGSSRGTELDVLRDIQRNALEAAAKAVCTGCEHGEPLDAVPWSEYHKSSTGRLRCAALRIKRLIPGNPAPAGTVTKGGGQSI
jgi:hypothetical protein